MTGRLRFRGLLGLSAALMVLAGCPISGAAQEPLRDSRTQRRVDVHPVTTLRFQDVTVFAPDVETQAVRLPDGGWGAISHLYGGSIAFFSATGAPTGTLGTPGPGPGEFKTARFALGVGKQLWVIDDGNNRLTAFGSDGSLVGDRRLPGSVFWAQPTADGAGLLLSGYFYGTTSDVRHVSTVARVTMNKADDVFGGDVGASHNPWVQQHLAAETPSGEIWAVSRAGGGIDILRSDNLQPVASSHLPENLSQPEAHPAGTPVTIERPGPRVLRVMVDSSGVLWMVMLVADAHWRARPDWDLHTRPPPVEEIFDTLILAVSPRDRAIVGAKRLDQWCLAVVDGLISCTNEDAQTIDIARVSLEP